MIIELNTASEVPIYVQLRNQIVLGIGRGELKEGESLPTVRQMAEDTGINMMTVNKAYGVLKAEGFIEIDRRHGAKICPKADGGAAWLLCGFMLFALAALGSERAASGLQREKVEAELELLIAETTFKGMKKEEFLKKCMEIYDRQQLVLQ